MEEDTAAAIDDLAKVDSPLLNAALAELKLEQQKAAEKQEAAVAQEGTPKAPQELTLFGYTMEAFFLSLVLSAVGVGYIRYGQTTAQPIMAIFGVALLVIPFFVTNAWALLAVGGGVLLLPLLLKRLKVI